MFKLTAVLFCVVLAWANAALDYERSVPPPPEVVVDVECTICWTAIKSDTNWSSRYFTEKTTSYFCSEKCLALFTELELAQQEN